MDKCGIKNNYRRIKEETIANHKFVDTGV